jgi:hypothetical protein
MTQSRGGSWSYHWYGEVGLNQLVWLQVVPELNGTRLFSWLVLRTACTLAYKFVSKRT